uniref:Uncharacterized protein LOC100374251 n=1 Tax=Saccoglossus kowalevskii TaxID=10224 RepID=A0ABM0MXZ5_SACKO|nr:PREDICTED: uncharacterized protein LOC100374251 [Saccoglossus kowalevskii]
MLFWNTTYWRYTTDLHRENLGIEIPRLEDLAKTGQHSWRQLVKYNQELRCVGFYDPHRFRADVPQYQAYQKIIDEHLVRSTWVKQITDVARADICEGRPYLALHFRNKTGEGCHFFLDVRGSECEALIPTISYVADIVTVIVVDYMQKFRLDCLYVAHPLWSYEIVDHLAAKIPRRNIYTSADISAEKHPELELFKEDMYFLSLLEQEICARSSAFIGCGRSNWSIFVWKERLAAGRVASYLLKQMPGIPKELQAHL